MSRPAGPDELLEVLGDGLRAVARDDPGPRGGIPLAGPPDDRPDVPLGHRFADPPVDEVPAAAVEQAAQGEERPGEVDVRGVAVPGLMGAERLLEPRSFE